MPVANSHPAWRHVNNCLSHLINALRAHPSFVNVSHPEELEHKDNAAYVWDFCRHTQAALQRIPPDLPYSHQAQWEDIQHRCMTIDGMINDPDENLNTITGQYPGFFSFTPEEKAATGNLVQGLFQLEDE